MVRVLLLLFAGVVAFDVRAQGPCAATPTPSAGDTAARIAAIACAEHELWYAPFIDESGRLASMRVAEAEGLRLRDGTTPAWHRVAAYWRGSGVRWPAPGLPPDADCGPHGTGVGAALCRSFLVDTPWSAVFVSWVLTQAGVPGFGPSFRHVDYVRAALRDGNAGPYRLADPDAEPPAVGDLLCFTRSPSPVMGAQGFRQWLGRPFAGMLPMHCDIVVATSGWRARLVGGNVLQGVTMRILPLNRLGRFWSLSRRSAGDAECHPSNPAACNFNRQDWVALLKLNPHANVPAPGSAPPAGPCCVICVLPIPEGMKRCPTDMPREAPANPPRQ